jgi:hypothetical protein
MPPPAEPGPGGLGQAGGLSRVRVSCARRVGVGQVGVGRRVRVSCARSGWAERVRVGWV